MRLKLIVASFALALITALCMAVDSPHSGPTDAMRVEGEKRFHANCGRCHAAPQKFPPRMMATIVRHMRVRATITDEDMRLVLFYMTQ
jgi:mono/diheme cytochrome c family protein